MCAESPRPKRAASINKLVIVYRAVKGANVPAYRYGSRARAKHGYRYFVMRQADALKVSGYARNRVDGSVEVVVEGSEVVVADFEVWLRQGFSFAEVTSLEREAIAERGSSGFHVR
jgi:acylphosphatase